MSEDSQPRPLTRNALVISVAFTVIVASVFGAYLTLTLGNNGQQLAITTTSISTCLQEVPANSTLIGGTANGTFVGTNVTLTNETQRLYPMESCPQPATPTLYNAALTIERNTSFIALENGSRYELDPVDSLGMHETGSFNGTYHDYSVVIFNDYSNQTYHPCSGNFISYVDLGQIQVGLDTLPNGSLDLLHPMFFVVHKDALNTWNCPLETITVSAATLYAGSASSSSFRGTANFSLSLNSDVSTNLTSLTLTLPGANNRSTPSNATVFQCTSNTQCAGISSLQILAGSITNFTSSATVFRFPSAILPGKAYIYEISFANAQSISGSVVAQ